MVSKVWLYATKLDDGQQAACQLCDFKCSCNSHSTSTIRQNLISKHNKTDLIIQSTSTSTYKTAISQALKNELHQLCYIAIIKDSRSFSDLNKHGIKTLLNKLCPGMFSKFFYQSNLSFIDSFSKRLIVSRLVHCHSLYL